MGKGKASFQGRRQWAGEGAASLGLTLVELMVTVVILAAGSLAALRMSAVSSASNGLAAETAIASTLAESELERIRSLGRRELEDEARAGPKTETGLDRFGLACQKAPCPWKRYDRTVRYGTGNVTALSTQIEVEVAWPSHLGRRRLVRGTALTWFSF